MMPTNIQQSWSYKKQLLSHLKNLNEWFWHHKLVRCDFFRSRVYSRKRVCGARNLMGESPCSISQRIIFPQFTMHFADCDRAHTELISNAVYARKTGAKCAWPIGTWRSKSLLLKHWRRCDDIMLRGVCPTKERKSHNKSHAAQRERALPLCFSILHCVCISAPGCNCCERARRAGPHSAALSLLYLFAIKIIQMSAASPWIARPSILFIIHALSGVLEIIAAGVNIIAARLIAFSRKICKLKRQGVATHCAAEPLNLFVC